MPAPLAKGIIITVSVLLAAGLAAYENPQIREWIDRSRQKIAMAIHSLGDEIAPRSRSPTMRDASMQEDASEVAEERRRRARQEILERGRIMEERRRRRLSRNASSIDSSIDSSAISLLEQEPNANSTSIQPDKTNGQILQRHSNAVNPFQSTSSLESFESQYERELRESWNLTMPARTTDAPSTHASDSLLDLTPTSEIPDPDFSIPPSQSHYFSAASSAIHSSSQPHPRTEGEEEEEGYYYAHPSNPTQPLSSTTADLRTLSPRPHLSHSSAPLNLDPPAHQSNIPNQAASTSNRTTADSVDLNHTSSSHSILLDSPIPEHDGDRGVQTDTEDGYSEIDPNADGLRTPASSVWTEVSSNAGSEI